MDKQDYLSYIVLECYGGAEYTIVVTNEDGINKVFDSYFEANEEAKDCQDGKVISI